MTDDELYDRCYHLFYVDNDFNLRRRISVAPNALKDSIAGGIDNSSGYLRVKVNRKSYLVHRLIYLMYHGVLPEIVDHIDGNPLNNNTNNLRAATSANNRWNSSGNSGSQTGVKGVYLDRNKYKGLICVNGVRYYLGMFSSLASARKVVEAKYAELQREFSLQNRKVNYDQRN